MKQRKPPSPPLPADHTCAFCYASGLIQFDREVPNGAIVIARGPEPVLRDYISGQARHGYETRERAGKLEKIEGSDALLVPGVPEARSEGTRMRALEQWLDRLKEEAPAGVLVI